MSLAILYRGKKVRFKIRFTNRRILSFLGIAAFIAIAYHQPWQDKGVNALIAQERIQQHQRDLAMQSDAVQQVRAQAQRELTAMSMKLGDIQAQIMRLEALSQRLASATQLDQGEFDFSQPMPVGGPDQPMLEWPVVGEHQVLADIDAVLEQLASRQKQLRLLESLLLSHHIEGERFIAGRPIVEGWLSSQYGVRKDPFHGNPTMHRGIDFAAPEGSPVIATGAGIVTFAGRRAGYGNLVEIDHGAGLRTRYGHMKSIDVQVGDVVTRGQTIARVGSVGRSTGPHVHYEVLENGRHVNPSSFVFRQVSGE
ncbi:peptidoglycan DD-metalloendopeptidase family protein [Aliidiomarina halalkaliphila]|uniref:Peptidoglycan DD-metalloendopeptidase family protein n=1 Tax=Aliidiomarina halalkaliphila TaxID=2593535 RepID=A0A552X5X4_9GAMM|nr:M23 family metallopeptidase [Aliidiomarina halalkaliphila]TRW50402.1 peptidoglycan DD-metalloendopeptidase family protein [Aliidiomarina halalkaliphila]